MNAKYLWMYAMIAILVFIGAFFIGAAINQ
jgi:hypothetical protein